MIRVKELKKLIEDNDFKVVMGGDDNQSELVLIPRKEHKKDFRFSQGKINRKWRGRWLYRRLPPKKSVVSR